MKLSFPREEAEIAIVYQGITFTLARASFMNGKRILVAEGLSRRSSVDAPNPEMGRFIASGRALRALEKKYKGERIRHTLMG